MSPLRSFQRVFLFCARGIHLISWLILFIGFVASAVPVAAQDPPADDEVLRVSTDLLLFPARVRDKNGKRPEGLSERDFSLEDRDGVTSGLYFSAGVDRVAMVFALDLSGSLRDLIGQQRDAAVGLYQRFGSKSSIAVLHFDESPRIAASFAHDPAAARAAFDVAARPNRHTAIFDAVGKAVEMFDSLPRTRAERRIVILISDGLDTASRIKPQSVIAAARNKRVSIYVIHLRQYEVRDGRVTQRKPTKGFVNLGSETGGGYIYPGDWAFDSRAKVNLQHVFELIENDLKSQYLIGFYLNEKANDGGRHNFSLSVPSGFEFEIPPRGYSRTHKFFVERPREVLKP